MTSSSIELTRIRGPEENDNDDETQAFLTQTPNPGKTIKKASSVVLAAVSLALLLFFVIVSSILIQQQQHQAGSSSAFLKDEPTNHSVQPKSRSPRPSSSIILTPLQELQVQNYRQGRALLLNLDIGHNAGNILCYWARSNGPVPSKDCAYDDSVIADLSTLKRRPWMENETQQQIQHLRKNFHMIQWPSNTARSTHASLNETDWENPNLVSIFVMPHPIQRLVSNFVDSKLVVNNSAADWWRMTTHPTANNDMLTHILGFGSRIIPGDEAVELYVQMAKSYLGRFTFLIDQDCLEEGLEALSKLLNLTYINGRGPSLIKASKPTDVFQNDSLYQTFATRNRRDLELYAWLKTKSLIQCNCDSPLVSSIIETDLKSSLISSTMEELQGSISQSIHHSLQQPQPSNQSLKDLQVNNYLNGTALMLLSHITHHGGTSFCKWARDNGPVPAFACVNDENNWPSVPESKEDSPWTLEETDRYVPLLRTHFHMVAWEYTIYDPKRSFHATNWLNPNLLSVIVMRHPLDRLQSGWEAPKKNATEAEWWTFAKGYHTDNYALRTLTSKEGCVQGEDTRKDCVWLAKRLLQQFTIVIDQACFDESMQALSDRLGLSYERDTVKHTHPPARERIGYDQVYDYLVRRNRRDIELYEWSKRLSLVNCSAI